MGLRDWRDQVQSALLLKVPTTAPQYLPQMRAQHNWRSMDRVRTLSAPTVAFVTERLDFATALMVSQAKRALSRPFLSKAKMTTGEEVDDRWFSVYEMCPIVLNGRD